MSDSSPLLLNQITRLSGDGWFDVAYDDGTFEKNVPRCRILRVTGEPPLRDAPRKLTAYILPVCCFVVVALCVDPPTSSHHTTRPSCPVYLSHVQIRRMTRRDRRTPANAGENAA
jgi:hypothetical protein